MGTVTVPGRHRTVELQSGSYALLCFLTDRAGGPPHVVKAKLIQEVKVP